MPCILCKSVGVKTFPINFLFGDANYTVKDDLTEFLGKEIEPYLKPEDVVCNVCMNFMDDIAKVKRTVIEIILSPNTSVGIYPVRLGKAWEFFAKSMKFEHFDWSNFGEPKTPSSSLTPLSVTPNPNRSTPSQFWSHTHSKEYIPELEEKFARREMVKRQRSQSKASIRSESSNRNDEEVAKLFRGRKRKGRRHKSAGGLPRITTKRQRKVQSENDRSYSSLSDMSYVSCTKIKKDFRAKTPKLIYGEDNELIRPRTRSISRMVFYCSDCLEDKKDLEMYTAHMIEIHNRKACYTCLDCNVNFLTEDHLSMHQRIHTNDTSCTICGETWNNIVSLQKHTDRHFQYSVPCSFCDLSFLSEYECNLHIFNRHRSRRRKLKDRAQSKIEEIATYVDVDSNKTVNTESCDSNHSTKNYTALPMILNVEKTIKIHYPSFDELDFRVRHPQPLLRSQQLTSLGDDLVQIDRSLCSRNSDSPSSIFSDTDGESPVSDSSASEFVSPKRRKRASRPRRRSGYRDREYSPSDLSPLDKLETSFEDSRLSDLSIVLDRFSPLENRILDLGTGPGSIISEDSDNSEHSDSIQTEMHYLVDGETHTNVDLADIININGSVDLGGSNPPTDGVELDPDIGII